MLSITVYQQASELPEGCLLADCAVSGGTLESFIRRALVAAQGKLCLRIFPVYADFPLPCPPGQEQSLTQEACAALCRDLPRHHTQALCTAYCTYISADRLHVVLCDTQDTVQEKLQLADALGVPYALMMGRPQAE